MAPVRDENTAGRWESGTTREPGYTTLETPGRQTHPDVLRDLGGSRGAGPKTIIPAMPTPDQLPACCDQDPEKGFRARRQVHRAG